MNNRSQISYTLYGAMVPFLCAAVNAEEVATHSMEVSEKILLMETINVTSNKEIAEEDETSGDPEVDQILNLVNSLTLLSEESTDESALAETDEVSDSGSDEVNVQSTNTETQKEIVPKADSDSSNPQKVDSKAVSDQKKKETN